MTCTPTYGVIYNGAYHPAGRPFEIDERDAEEMKAHGKVEGVRQEGILTDASDPAPKRTRKAK